jgi:allantoin racemase
MKITILGAFSEELIRSLGQEEIILGIARKAAHPDTEITWKGLGKGLTDLHDGDYYSFHMFCETTMLMGLYNEQDKGADALIEACFYDPALLAARGIVNIPVIGSAEASLHLACSMGSKFAIVVPYEEIQHIHLRNALTYGLRDRMIDYKPVRAIPSMDWTAVDPRKIIDGFMDTARSCIADGAEVIILGCWAWPPVLTANNIFEVDGIPLIDPCIASVKYAELFASLKKANVPWISRKSMYKTPPKDVADKYFSQFIK